MVKTVVRLVLPVVVACLMFAAESGPAHAEAEEGALAVLPLAQKLKRREKAMLRAVMRAARSEGLFRVLGAAEVTAAAEGAADPATCSDVECLAAIADAVSAALLAVQVERTQRRVTTVTLTGRTAGARVALDPVAVQVQGHRVAPLKEAAAAMVKRLVSAVQTLDPAQHPDEAQSANSPQSVDEADARDSAQLDDEAEAPDSAQRVDEAQPVDGMQTQTAAQSPSRDSSDSPSADAGRMTGGDIERASGMLPRSEGDSDSGAPATGESTPVSPETWEHSRSGLRFIRVPAGRSTHGCEGALQDACEPDEQPARATQTEVFWLGETEVTAAAYAGCVEAGSCPAAATGVDSPTETCNLKNERGDHPANCVTLEEAGAFCAWVGGSLPTAQQWEHAAQSGGASTYPWGEEPVSPQRGNYCDGKCPEALTEANRKQWLKNGWVSRLEDGWASTAPVGSYPAGRSVWGLLDMAGNVWEMTATDKGDNSHEMRGGGWISAPPFLRATNRGAFYDDERASYIGFRCARTDVGD